MTETTRAFQLSLNGHRAPVEYDRPPTYSRMVTDKDVMVPMRDGVRIAVDVYRPATAEKLRPLRQGGGGQEERSLIF